MNSCIGVVLISIIIVLNAAFNVIIYDGHCVLFEGLQWNLNFVFSRFYELKFLVHMLF
jgi:hypothetical protein